MRTDNPQVADRYFHLGNFSAGCFTNIIQYGAWQRWDIVVEELLKCRKNDGNDLYVGTIELRIPDETIRQIQIELRAMAQQAGLSYIWNHNILNAMGG